jgi:hypothetical protein
MCNCSPNPANICTQCQGGNPCGCPPDYSILPQPVPCGCCPTGYTFFGPTPNWPSGYCQSNNAAGSQVPPVSCNDCPETMSADCVILPAVPCLGLPAGLTVSQFAAFLCSAAFIQTILTNIGLNSILGSGFCQLVQNCPPVGSGTTPIIGSITITYP